MTFRYLPGIPELSVPPEFDTDIMAGTITALILHLHKRILTVFAGILPGERNAITCVTLIIVSGIPTGVIGCAGREFFKSLFGQPVGVSLFRIISSVSSPSHQRRKADRAINCGHVYRYSPGHRHCSGYFEVGSHHRNCDYSGDSSVVLV